MSAPTPKQIGYLKHLCWKAGKAFEMPENSHHAYLMISALVKPPDQTKTDAEQLNEALWAPGEELAADRAVCGFDAFGDWAKPFCCRQPMHKHPANVELYLENELRQLPRSGGSEIRDPQEEEAQAPGEGYSKLNNSNPELEGPLRMEDSQPGLSDAW